MSSTGERARAVLLTAIMVTSVVAVGSAGFAGPAAAQSVTTTVSGSGSALQTAVDSAEDGDVIEVSDSATYDQVIINRSDDASNLTIRAADGASPTISHGAADGTPTVAIDQDNVTLEGFTVKRTGSDSRVAQAVRVAGDDVTLTDNTYELDGSANDAAIGVLTSSSGAAGNPDVSGVTIDDVSISGGEVVTNAASQTGVLVADDGAAGIQSEAVSVSGVTFTANADSTHVLELDTGGGVVDTTAALNDNSFSTAAAPDATAGTINGFERDGLVASTVQAAVDGAATGATVEVVAGTYDESVTVGVKGLTLEGPNAGTPGDSASRGSEAVLSLSGTYGIEPTADNVVVDGFSINGTATQLIGNNRASGIGYEVTNNVFKSFDETAVRPQSDAEGVIVTDNRFEISGSTQGFQAAATNVTATFRGNVFNDGQAGIGVAEASAESVEFTIEDNEFNNQTFASVYTDSGLNPGASVSVNFPSFQNNEFSLEGVGDSNYLLQGQGTNQIASGSTFGLQDIAASNTFDTDVLVTSTDLRPSPVTDVTLSNPSGRQLDLSVTTTGDLSSLTVDLGGDTEETGTDVTLSEFSGPDSNDVFTADVTANVSAGSSSTYQIDVTEVNGSTGTDDLPTSRQRVLTVQTFDGGSATVDPQATNVSSVTVTSDSGTGSELTVSSPGALPATGDQRRAALVSDVGAVDSEDTVLTALDINAVGAGSATIQFTVDRASVSNDPTDLLVARFDGGSYRALQTAVVESTGSTITIEARTPGTSPFAVVETDADPADPVPDSGGGGSNVQGVLAVAEGSVTGQIPTGPVSEVTVEFDQPTTGGVQIESANGFPAGAPTPEGQVVSTVEIAPPDDVASLPGAVELTVDRSAVSDAGADPADLQLVRYNERSGELEALETDLVSETDRVVVLSAETPGFSVFGVVATDRDTPTTTATATPEPTATATPGSTAAATSEPTATATPESTPAPTEGGGPGFGAAVALVALLVGVVLAVRRGD